MKLINEVKRLQELAGIRNESFDFGKIKSISNLKSAVEHLYPNAKIMHEKDDTYDYLKINPLIGYLYVEGTKGFLILTYDKSHYTEDMVGVVWINGDSKSSFEFSTIQELEKIVGKYKNKLGL